VIRITLKFWIKIKEVSIDQDRRLGLLPTAVKVGSLHLKSEEEALFYNVREINYWFIWPYKASFLGQKNYSYIIKN
jgi:hypothetical protein